MCITHILAGIETIKLQAFMRENVTTIFFYPCLLCLMYQYYWVHVKIMTVQLKKRNTFKNECQFGDYIMYPFKIMSSVGKKGSIGNVQIFWYLMIIRWVRTGFSVTYERDVRNIW